MFISYLVTVSLIVWDQVAIYKMCEMSIVLGAFPTQLLWQVPVSNRPGVEVIIVMAVPTIRCFTRCWNAQFGSTKVMILLRQSFLRVISHFRPWFYTWSGARVHGAPLLPSARKSCSPRKR